MIHVLGLQLCSPQEQDPRGSAPEIANFLNGGTRFRYFGRGAADANFVDTMSTCGPDFQKKVPVPGEMSRDH